MSQGGAIVKEMSQKVIIGKVEALKRPEWPERPEWLGSSHMLRLDLT